MASSSPKPPEVIAASDAVSDGSRDLSQHQACVMWMQSHLASDPTAELKWLDLGCGKGQILFAVEKNLAAEQRSRIAFVGVDGSEAHAKATEARALTCRLKSVDVHHADVGNLAALSGKNFDLITLINICHELPPKKVGGILLGAIELLAPNGRLLAYDMEQLPRDGLELGALTWRHSDIEELAKAVVSPLSPAVGAVYAGSWNHHSCTAWSMWVMRSQLKPAQPISELRGVCIAAASKATEAILTRRVQSVRDTLESLTKHGAATPAEQVDAQRALHDLWALDRARSSS